MRRQFAAWFKRNEMYVVATVIAVVFLAAMGIVTLLLRSSMATPPYETLGDEDIKKVFATGYLRFREDDGTPYLKIEFHNGTLWWIRKVEFDFAGTRYTLRDTDAFRPLHFGALRFSLKSVPEHAAQIEYDLKIIKAYGYPPAHIQWERQHRKIAVDGKEGPSPKN